MSLLVCLGQAWPFPRGCRMADTAPKCPNSGMGGGEAKEGCSSGSKSLSEVFPVRVLLTSLVRRCTTAREAWEMSSYFFLASVVEVGKRERVG